MALFVMITGQFCLDDISFKLPINSPMCENISVTSSSSTIGKIKLVMLSKMSILMDGYTYDTLRASCDSCDINLEFPPSHVPSHVNTQCV